MAARKTSRKKRKAKARAKAKKGTWGGRRPGAGRPRGSGKGPSPLSRRNRVAVMLTDAELKTLRGVARKKSIPVSTAAYRFIAKSLAR
jgi:DNA invertase Pin-like site-specific DNA recombinase